MRGVFCFRSGITHLLSCRETEKVGELSTTYPLVENCSKPQTEHRSVKYDTM